tara:strand:+ start:707 stop:3454 length:2748 start_codon:yes stop_codon:yes gene_type:complete
MTDSFQNIVGTPRDQVPDISKTNYLETGADLTEAMLEAQDDAIKDTKRHFDQMVELEQLAASKFDKRLNSLTNIIGNVAKIRKAQLAREADGLGKAYKLEYDKDFDAELAAIENTISNSQNYDESRAKGEILRDKNVRNKLELISGIPQDEIIEGDLKTRLSYFAQPNILYNINDNLSKNGAFESTTNEQFNEYAERTKEAFIRTAIYNEFVNGGDPYSKRFKKRLYKDIMPKVQAQIDKAQGNFQFALDKKFQEEQNYIRDNRIITAVKGAYVKDKNTGKRFDDTIFKKEGIIDQIAVEKNMSKGQATDFFFRRVADLVEGGEILPHEAREIYQNLEYYAANENYKKYDSLQAFVNAQKDQTTPFVARQRSNIQELSKKINDIEKARMEDDKAQAISEANAFVNQHVIPLMFKNKDATGTTKLDPSQIGGLLRDFKKQPFYKDGITPIPEILKSALNQTQTGGQRDINVTVANKYASHFKNVREKFIEPYVKSIDPATQTLGPNDIRIVERLMDQYKARFLDVDGQGQGLKTFEAAIAANPNYTIRDYRDEILGTKDGSGKITVGILSETNLKAIDKAIADGPIPLAESGAQSYLNVKSKIAKDRTFFQSKQAFEGEPVNRLLDFVTDNNNNREEILRYYGGLKVTIINDNGEVEVLSGTEAAYQRAETLGIYDPETKMVNPYADVFQNTKTKNEFTKNPNDNTAIQTMSFGDKRDFEKALKVWSKNSGDNIDEDSYTIVRGARPGREATNLTKLTLGQVIDMASRGQIENIGMYNFTQDAMAYFAQNAEKLDLDLNAKMTEDLQSYLVIMRVKEKANRKNAIRGAVTKETEGYRRMINLRPEELEAVNKVFPNLQNNYFAKFENLQKDVADILISDLERFNRLIAGGRQKAKIEKIEKERLRKLKTKRELRGR